MKLKFVFIIFFHDKFLINSINLQNKGNHCFHIYLRSLKTGLYTHVLKVSTQNNMCISHRLIREDTFQSYGTFRLKKVFSKRKSRLGGKCRPRLVCVHMHLALFSHRLVHILVDNYESVIDHKLTRNN